MLFAAHSYVFTSHDGMVIANVINFSPFKLHKLVESPKWTECLKFWGYTSDGVLEGELYRDKVGEKKTLNSLRQASKLWRELFGLKPIRKLDFFKRLNHENQQTKNSLI